MKRNSTGFRKFSTSVQQSHLTWTFGWLLRFQTRSFCNDFDISAPFLQLYFQRNVECFEVVHERIGYWHFKINKLLLQYFGNVSNLILITQSRFRSLFLSNEKIEAKKTDVMCWIRENCRHCCWSSNAHNINRCKKILKACSHFYPRWRFLFFHRK